MANARGAAFLALVGLGFMKFEEVPELVGIEREFVPAREHRSVYNEVFELFLKAWKFPPCFFLK